MITTLHIQKLVTREAVDRFIASRYDNDIEKFLGELDSHINHLIRTDLKEAGRVVSAAELLFAHLPKLYQPRLLAMKGRYYNWTGDYSSALKCYKRAVKLFEKAGDKEAVARTGKGLMDVNMYLGRYDAALEIGRKSLKYYRRRKMLNDCGQVLTNIGNVYHRMDNNRMALRYYEKARAIFQKSGGIPLAIVEYNRANIYSNLNKLHKAEALYNVAAGLYRQVGRRIAENRAKYSLGYLLFLEDRYTEAIKVFEDVYEKFVNLGDPKSAAVTQLDMVEINVQLNQYGSAIMIADHIIPELRRLGMRYEEAKAYFFASDARIRLGDYRLAAEQLKNAETLFAGEGNNLWLGMIHIAKSKLFMAQSKYARAIRAAGDAKSFFARSGDERRKNDAEIVLLEAVLRSGDVSAALRLSRPLSKKKLISYQRYNLNCLVGQCHYNLRDYVKALARFKAAVSIIEKMLSGLYPDEIRFFFVVDKYSSYKRVVDCLLHMGRINDSFLTNLKALETINRKAALEERAMAEVPSWLLERRSEFRAALKKLNRSPRGAQRALTDAPSYYSIEQKLWSNERRIRSILYPEAEDSWHVRGLKAPDVREHLGSDETIVNFLATESTTGAFCATTSSVEFVKLDITPDELEVLLRKLHFVFEKAVFGLRDAERTKSIAEYYLGQIYRRLFEPLVPHIAGRRIFIIADSRFDQVPLVALKDDRGRYLKDKFELRIVVNPEDLTRRGSEVRPWETGRSAIFAVSSDLLPSIDLEARKIKNVFRRSKLYINEKANIDNLNSELKEADGFVHIAAHASRSSENPLFSRILMGDGPFFPFDLFESGVRARLVTLSGCQTAAPGLYIGNSFSLAKAFYQAGSQHVLASLWPVSDKLSMLFMIDFYKTLADVGDVYQAYLSAVEKVIGFTDNPAFWSSFLLLGI
ncbi:MAG: CHAT domain-containing protein [Candidatus Zixiibacteriota bacterium]|nr:MAG: CHAT domain-containing protein [candidate division Zixibacteria bacterium]